MINTFREALAAYMGDNFYMDEAPKDANYPYRVASLNGSYDEEVSAVFNIELDYWDSGKSYERINEIILSDAGNGITSNPTGLNKRIFNFSNGSVFMALDNIIPIQDSDKNLRRMRASYTARFYFGGK